MSREKPMYGTSILKAVSVMQCISEQEEPMGASRIAHHTGLPRSTVFKLLDTLTAVGFVEKSAHDATYRLGIGLVKLAGNAMEQLDLVQVARPYLKELNRQTEETIHLGIPEHDQVVYVDKLESRQAVRMYSRVGKTAPLYCTGIGKAMLSRFPSKRLDAYLKEVHPAAYTSRTLTDPEAIRRDLEASRSRGYAIDHGEHEEDVRCIAVPLYRGDKVYGAVSISAPEYRMNAERVAQLLPKLLRCQQNILHRLP